MVYTKGPFVKSADRSTSGICVQGDGRPGRKYYALTDQGASALLTLRP
jgi:hypothetical protein